MDKNELKKNVSERIDEIMREKGYFKKKELHYYMPAHNRFLYTICFDIVNYGNNEGFSISPYVGIKNMNVTFVQYEIDKSVFDGDVIFFSDFFSNIGSLSLQGQYKTWYFSTNHEESRRIIDQMMVFLWETCDTFFQTVSTPEKYIEFAASSESFTGIRQTLLMYYCCNRKDLGIKYLESLRGERIERIIRNRRKERVERFIYRYEHELPEDPDDLLKQVPAFCKKRRIKIID